jgi:MFS family permease
MPSALSIIALVCVSLLCHVAMNGSRVAVSLYALKLHASPLTVGALMALYALLPMLLSIWAGRLVDRIGPRAPILTGLAGVIAGCALPAVWPAAWNPVWVLYAAAVLIGISFMIFQVAAQNAVGELDDGPQRAANFGLLAIGMSISGLFGPVIAGFAIDHLGYRASFAVLAVFPFGATVYLLANLSLLPASVKPRERDPDHRLSDLLRDPHLRRVLIANALLAMGWDLHTFIIPIYGTGIGLSASTIGLTLGAFGLATFLIRLTLPWLQKHMTEWHIIRTSLLAAGAAFLFFPAVTYCPPASRAPLLMALSFSLGITLGCSQPSVLSLLHNAAPEGRVGEAFGLRTAVLNFSSVSLPLLCGGLGAAIGMPLVFWSMAGSLLAGGWFAPRGKAA